MQTEESSAAASRRGPLGSFVRGTIRAMVTATRRVGVLPLLILSLTIAVPSVVAPMPAAAAGDPVACTNWKSLISPPKTIRVLRNRTGLVEVVPFRTYVYRTHVAEFWSEYLSPP